jgi:hypothetical protein
MSKKKNKKVKQLYFNNSPLNLKIITKKELIENSIPVYVSMNKSFLEV